MWYLKSSCCDIENKRMSLLWEGSFFSFDDFLSGFVLFFVFFVSFNIVFYLFFHFCPDWLKSTNWNKKKNNCLNICKWCKTLLSFLQQMQQVILAFLWAYWLHNIILACKDFLSLTYFFSFFIIYLSTPLSSWIKNDKFGDNFKCGKVEEILYYT